MKWIAPLFTLVMGLIFGLLLGGSGPEDAAIREEVSESERVLIEVLSSGEVPAEGSSIGAAEFVAESGGELDANWLRSLEGMSSFERMGALYLKLKTAQSADIAPLMEEYMSDNRKDWHIVNMLGTRWAELDPEGMFRYIDSEGSDNISLYNTLYSTWTMKDPAAALQSISGLRANVKKHAAATIAISMLETSPNEALQIMKEYLGTGHSTQWQYQQFFTKWAEYDLDAAMAATEAMGDSIVNTSALIAVMSVESKDDPVLMLQKLRSLDLQGHVKRSALSQAINQLYRESPQAAMDYISASESFMERKQLLESLYFNQSNDPQDYEALVGIADWLDTVATGQLHQNKLRNILNAMAQADPHRAQEYVLRMEYGDARTGGLAQVARVLAEKDFEAALAFAYSLEFEDERFRALETIGWQIRQSDPEQAREFVLSGDAKLQERLAGQIASDWAVYDRASALIWVDQLQSDQAQRNAIGNILRTWVLDDPEAAFGYIAGIEDEKASSSHYRSALQTYVREDPASAVVWLDMLAEQERLGDHPENHYRDAARSYLQMDPMAASEWIATLGEGKARDHAVGALVDHVRRTDPEAGFVWAATIDDSNQQKRYLERSVRDWVKVDADAAMYAIRNADIEESQKESLYKLAQK